MARFYMIRKCGEDKILDQEMLLQWPIEMHGRTKTWPKCLIRLDLIPNRANTVAVVVRGSHANV